jgi:LacI family transcriptional regulator
MAGLMASGLTTVHQPMRELGAETARQLLRHVEGQADVSLDRVLETQVVIRGSCGCGEQVSDVPATKPATRTGRKTGRATGRAKTTRGS